MNLFKLINADVTYFHKFGSTNVEDLVRNFFIEQNTFNSHNNVIFLDQEPFELGAANEIFGRTRSKKTIVVTSEHSKLVTNYCKEMNFYHIYYFFHGFACLDWYRDCWYFKKEIPNFSKKFISFNRLCTDNRSYRLFFVSELKKRNILSKGLISLQIINNEKNVVKKEIFNKNCRLSKNAKKQVWYYLNKEQNNYEIDKKDVKGSASADFGPKEYKLWQNSFLHVVTETVFFDQKLHLTEKIFKPIVSRRPFVLLGAYKNLEYLKSYGFKTFDKWIDESYDEEPDNEKRLIMVCDEVEKIANLQEDKIKSMYFEMQEILDFNFYHFYTNFKKIIVTELVNNFEGYLRYENNGVRLYDEVYDIESLNLPEVKRLLAQ